MASSEIEIKYFLHENKFNEPTFKKIYKLNHVTFYESYKINLNFVP